MAKNKYIEECNLIDAMDWDADKKLWTIDDKKLNEIPTADVAEVIHAKWNVILSSDNWNIRCSNCGRVFDRFVNGAILPEYCFCGAIMDMKDS